VGIDKTELIAGQPIKLVRDLLTKIGGREYAAVEMAAEMMEIDRKKRWLG
jgi:hypothetical protein